MDDDDIPTAPWWVWLGLTVMAILSFWTQATVTEERFVPALNVIAYEYNIPSDIAGATLMAAGASSPELFSSFVALFITHSALGLGTIVGSEIFNQLVICAGAVYASRSGQLQLDKAIVIREVGFYGLSIALLYIALRDRRPADDDELGDEHIYISFFDACILFGGYLAYVLVCAKMDSIVALFTCADGGGSVTQTTLGSGDAKNYGAVHGRAERSSFNNVPHMPFLREVFEHEPAGNFAEQEALLRTPTGDSLGSGRSSLGSISEGLRRFSDGSSLRHFFFHTHDEKPSDDRNIHDIEFNAKEGRLSCFMWQRSFFYDKSRSRKNGWHLRWFSFTKESIKSVPDRTHFEKHRMIYPKFKKLELDEKRQIIRIENPDHCKRREFYFMAPSDEVFNAVVDRMEELWKDWESEAPQESTTEETADKEFDNSDPHVDLTELPTDASIFGFCWFLFSYPLRFIMQWTIGDVRTMDNEGNPTSTLGKAYCAIFMCLVWLVVGSYAMVASLERLAVLMDIPDAVIGVTVSAAGTSLPNYVASKVAAQKGFGNMAVSNAFGSNTFNIMVGLGLPWMLYIATNGLLPYHALQDDGISISVIILGTVLAVFIVLVVPTGFVLYRWHGHLFIFLYLSYLAYVICQVYL